MKLTTKIKDPFTLGQILQQNRLQQGLSQRELAKELDTTQKWIWEMEQGKPGILMERLFKMLDAVEVELFAEFEITEGSEGNDVMNLGETVEETSADLAQKTPRRKCYE